MCVCTCVCERERPMNLETILTLSQSNISFSFKEEKENVWKNYIKIFKTSEMRCRWNNWSQSIIVGVHYDQIDYLLRFVCHQLMAATGWRQAPLKCLNGWRHLNGHSASFLFRLLSDWKDKVFLLNNILWLRWLQINTTSEEWKIF